MAFNLPARTDFDAETALAEIRKEALIRRKASYHTSRLDRFRAELLAMRRLEARPVELQAWLRKQRCKVALSTVTRWLERNAR